VPTPTSLQAAEDLARARDALGWFDGAVLRSVLIEGRTIEKTAKHLLPGSSVPVERRHMGHRLRVSLMTLASLWWPASVGRHVHAWRDADAKPSEATSGAISHAELAGAVVHAGRRGWTR
jgi:hypothetical protein